MATSCSSRLFHSAKLVNSPQKTLDCSTSAQLRLSRATQVPNTPSISIDQQRGGKCFASILIQGDNPLPDESFSQTLTKKSHSSIKVNFRRLVAVSAKGRARGSDSYPAPKRQTQNEGESEVDFDDISEEEIQTFLDLDLQSDLGPSLTRHYECVFLIHEDNFEEVPQVVQKVKDKIATFKGTIWRLNDWGLRRMAYKIKKANKANYILLNFEILPSQLEEFQKMMLTDERIIRHLVMKMKGPETEDYPPPPEWGQKADSENEYEYSDGEEDEDEEEEDEHEWDEEDGVVVEGNKEEDEVRASSDLRGPPQRNTATKSKPIS